MRSKLRFVATAPGCSRPQAIDSFNDIVVEIDRSIPWPGQALA